jgi:methyl-accepting chemotaxis protein
MINNAINGLNQITQQNAASSEEMASGSEELAGQAEQLKQLICFFKVSDINYEKITNIQVKNKNKVVDKFELPNHNLPGKKVNQPFAGKEIVKKEQKNKGVVISFDDKDEDEFEVFR